MVAHSQPPKRHHAAPIAIRPTLSILCPTYNRLRMIKRFLSHHTQGFTDQGISFEVLVSDNGSTDGSREFASAFAADNDCIRYIEQSENIGAYANWLYLWRQARGEFVAYLGDDDLLVPEAVTTALSYLKNHPECVMWQAPWLLLDETRGNAVMGQFYHLDGAYEFVRGQHGACLGFVLDRHIFPESYILRGSAISRVMAPTYDHAFVFFTQLSRALDIGSVMFSPEPFAKMTAVTAGDNTHAGNSEVMIGWDRYRGGLEYMAARAREGDSSALGDMPTFLVRMQQFVCQRMAVAVKMHVAAGNWRDAFYLGKRLEAYGVKLPELPGIENLLALSGLQTCFAEAAMMKRSMIVLDPKVPEMFVEALNPKTRGAFVRPSDPLAATQASKAHIVLGPKVAWPVGDHDVVIDLAAVISQFE